MIELDLYELAKRAPEDFKGFWKEMRKELNINEEYKDIFENVFCHGFCKALDEIVGIIARETIKPQAVC